MAVSRKCDVSFVARRGYDVKACEAIMIFNGLEKSDLVIFNALNECDLSEPVPVSKLARLTCYEDSTVRQALNRLVDYRIITRHRAGNGHPYTYRIKRNGYAVLDT